MTRFLAFLAGVAVASVAPAAAGEVATLCRLPPPPKVDCKMDYNPKPMCVIA